MGATETVAQFVTTLKAADIPQEALRRARTALLDCIGCAVAGAKYSSSGLLLDFIRDCGGAPQATVMGTNLRTSAPDAALANGMLSSALLYEDT